jgi:virulence-associated protein VagC
MHTTKVFKSGNSQAIRIPKEYHLLDTNICIYIVNKRPQNSY